MIKNDDELRTQISRVRKLAAAFVSRAHGTKTAFSPGEFAIAPET